MTHAHVLTVTIRPTPTPAPTPAVRMLAERESLAKPARSAARTAARTAARPSPIRLTHSAPPATTRSSSSKPIWDLANGHATAGSLAGNGTAAAGTGSGSGSSGTGSDSAANLPCGFVTFSDPHGSQFDPRTRGFWVDIRVSVHFAGGTSESMILDYPWYYPSEAANPWSDQNLKDPAFPTRFQPPPPEKIAGEPPLVKYVMERSTSEGMTLLHDCPTPTPSASGTSQ